MEAHLGQSADELICKSLGTRLFHEVFSCLGVGILPFCANQAKLDICVDGVVEETRFLLHKANLCPPPLEVNLS